MGKNKIKETVDEIIKITKLYINLEHTKEKQYQQLETDHEQEK